MTPARLLPDSAASRWAARLPWVVWGISVALAALGGFFVIATLGVRLPPRFGFRGFVELYAVVAASVGALVASKRPENPIGWLFTGVGVAGALLGVFEDYANYTLFAGHGWHALGLTAGWLQSWWWMFLAVPLVTILPQLFPTGRPLSVRWRVLLPISIGGAVIAGIGFAFTPGPMQNLGAIPNPVAVGALDRIGQLLPMVWIAVTIPAVISLGIRFRRSAGVEREQLKWLLGAVVVIIVGLVVEGVTGARARAGTGGEGFSLIDLLGLMFLPVAVSVAILRYRLYDIDRIISRTVSYTLVTAVLGGVFMLVVLAPTTLLGGGHAPSWLIATATLVVAALFRPVRRRVQGGVDRRFNRARYDAERTIEGFVAHLREETDIAALGNELEAIVSQTMLPEHVSLWLRA